jgi:hypothetical protein
MKSKTSKKKPVRISKRPFVPKIVKARIKRLKKDFLAAAATMLSADNGVRWNNVVKKIAKKWGLKMFSHTGLSGFAFKSKKAGLILKAPYLCSDMATPPCGIYTEAFTVDVPCEDWDPIFIQPLADVSHEARMTAYSLFEDAIAEGMIDYTDTHSENVGIYKGKAVKIDW